MDDAFSLIAAEMTRTRRISPFEVRASVAVMTAMMFLVSFAMFVTGQQRAADERRSAMVAQRAAERQAEAHETTVVAASPTLILPEQGSVDRLLDSRGASPLAALSGRLSSSPPRCRSIEWGRARSRA